MRILSGDDEAHYEHHESNTEPEELENEQSRQKSDESAPDPNEKQPKWRRTEVVTPPVSSSNKTKYGSAPTKLTQRGDPHV